MERYICKECGAEANVNPDGTLVRSCKHTSTVTLDINVVCTGEGGIDG